MVIKMRSFKALHNLQFVNKIFSLIITVMLSFLGIQEAYADDESIPLALQQADSAYNKGDEQLAIEKYLDIIKIKGESSDLLFNLANAYYKNGEISNAIVSLVRANKLDPQNESVKSNLAFLRTFIKDANRGELKGKKGSVEPDDVTFLGNIFNWIAKDNSSNTWAIWSAASFVLLIIFIAIYLFIKNVLIRKIGFFGGLSLLFLTIVFTVFAFMAARSQTGKDIGVITGAKVSLIIDKKDITKTITADSTVETIVQGNSKDKVTTIPLHAGTEVTILSDTPEIFGRQPWVNVYLNSDIHGWMPADDLQVVSL